MKPRSTFRTYRSRGDESKYLGMIETLYGKSLTEKHANWWVERFGVGVSYRETTGRLKG